MLTDHRLTTFSFSSPSQNLSPWQERHLEFNAKFGINFNTLGLLHYLHWMQTQLSLQASSAAAVTMSTVTEYAVPDTPDIVFPRVKHCSKEGRDAYVIYIHRQNSAMQRYVKRWRELQSVEIGERVEQGGRRGRAWQHSLPFKIEDSICSEPHLEVDTEEEPKTAPIQETGQT